VLYLKSIDIYTWDGDTQVVVGYMQKRDVREAVKGIVLKSVKLQLKQYAFLILFAALLFVSFSAYSEPVGDLAARFSEESDIAYEETTYRLRKRLTTVLLAGTDQRMGYAPAENEYRNGGQADFLLLVVIDDNRDTVQPILLNRDTMTRITVLNLMGNVSGTRMAQICLAHGFGDGMEQSCELLRDAVSGLLLNVPIDYYAAMNLDGIAAFNDALGGVEVTLEEDLTVYDPAMYPGATLVLKGMQAEYYVRERYYVGDQTNISRMNRQMNYMNLAAQKLAESAATDQSFVNTLVGAVSPMVVTDMNKGAMANLTSRAVEYELLPILTIDGEAVQGNGGFMEFYPDEESLQKVVLEAFYAPVD